MIGIELFSGAGGMSLGASNAGIEIKMAVEIDKSAALTFQVNHPKAIVITDDIRNIKDISIEAKPSQKKILFGGPPCQGFSRSNHRTRNRSNDKNWLFEEFARLTKLWMPEWIVLENVEGLLGTDGGFFIKEIIAKFISIGYTITYKVLNSEKYGVPQRRSRLFIVGSREGIEFEFPEPKLNSIITVEEAISDLPLLNNGDKSTVLPYRQEPVSNFAKKLRGSLNECNNHGVSTNTEKVIERYKHIKEGGNWKDIPIHLMDTYTDVSRCHTGIYHRLNNLKPSVVIGNYRKNMLIHPNQNRGLSVREAARLQSFPDWFEFKGTLNEQQQQVGNAVPPYLAQAIFEKIKEYN
jgi:DNA (cytosine-5)-methyltransferase 1